MTIRVVITDDHPVVRDGLRFCIERSGRRIEVVGEAGTGREVLDLVANVRADVVIMDVTMPFLNGIEATRELLGRDPSIRIIMLSLQSSDSVVIESLRAGARGFVTKETATRCVVDAIEAVHGGRYFLSPDVAHCVARPILDPHHPDDDRETSTRLTPQETKVLQLIAENHTNREIAALLALSIHTVHSHRKNLMAKLGIHDQATLARYALRQGIAKL